MSSVIKFRIEADLPESELDLACLEFFENKKMWSEIDREVLNGITEDDLKELGQEFECPQSNRFSTEKPEKEVVLTGAHRISIRKEKPLQKDTANPILAEEPEEEVVLTGNQSKGHPLQKDATNPQNFNTFDTTSSTCLEILPTMDGLETTDNEGLVTLDSVRLPTLPPPKPRYSLDQSNLSDPEYDIPTLISQNVDPDNSENLISFHILSKTGPVNPNEVQKRQQFFQKPLLRKHSKKKALVPSISCNPAQVSQKLETPRSTVGRSRTFNNNDYQRKGIHINKVRQHPIYQKGKNLIKNSYQKVTDKLEVSSRDTQHMDRYHQNHEMSPMGLRDSKYRAKTEQAYSDTNIDETYQKKEILPAKNLPDVDVFETYDTYSTDYPESNNESAYTRNQSVMTNELQLANKETLKSFPSISYYKQIETYESVIKNLQNKNKKLLELCHESNLQDIGQTTDLIDQLSKANSKIKRLDETNLKLKLENNDLKHQINILRD